MNTSLDELNRWLSAPREDEHLEFQEAKNQYDLIKLFRYCVALANEGGGKLILGVTNKPPRQIVGSQAFPVPSDVQSKVLDKLRFRVEAEEIQHPDGRVLVFHIPSRPSGTAYQFDGSYLMRSGEDTVPMTEDQLRRIFGEGKPDWLFQFARQGLTADEVIRLLDTQSYFDLLKLPYPNHRDGVLERFDRERLIVKKDEGYMITNMGALLFAKRLDEFESVSRKAARIIG
jgi:ATP-dependent DNA helicase RecG